MVWRRQSLLSSTRRYATSTQDELREALSIIHRDSGIDNQTAFRLKRRLAQEFRDQLTLGFQTNEDEAWLRRLADQIRSKKLVVKLFLRHSLHAKLYLLFRSDPGAHPGVNQPIPALRR